MSEPFGLTGYVPPAKVDERNFPYEKAVAPQPFPPVWHTDVSGVPIFHQHKIPSCVENAITFVKKYHIWKDYNLTTDLSRRFLAILTVQKDGFPIDNGTSIQNALYIAYKQGICESRYLADDHELDTKTYSDISKVTAVALENAKNHKVANYAFLTDHSVNGLKNAIHQNGVIVVGALINENWWTAKNGQISWEAKDILPIRPPKTRDTSIDSTLSGHCFVLSGYDEKYFYGPNSFGPDWGEKGFVQFGVDEVPFIYEAATIVDLTPEKVEVLKETQKQAVELAEVVHNLDPKSPDYPKILLLLSQVLPKLRQIINSIFT